MNRQLVGSIAFMLGLISSAHSGINREMYVEGNWDSSSKECQIFIISCSNSFILDEAVRLHILLLNMGQHPMHIIESPPLSSYRIEMLLPTKEPALLDPFAQLRFRRARSRTLNPGDYIISTIPALNTILPMTMLGEYTIRVHRNVRISGDGGVWTEIASNTLRVRIHDDINHREEHQTPIFGEQDELPPDPANSYRKQDESGRIIAF